MSMEPRRLGKYELLERLARGGQGEVWKAFDPQLRRYVAIKQLHANVQSDPDFISRFEREARFIASLHHPNIVQIHDFQLVLTPGSDATTAYMVMEHIEGPTLADYIRRTSRKGQFPAPVDIVSIFTAISLAMDYAHEKGMIHRDIKPANIILDQRSPGRNPLGRPILTDFGIARLQGVSADRTKVLGTPLYISPEQAHGLVGDRRSDLYSLGIILYEMTTGVTPFRSDSVMALLMQHSQAIPTPPALINPDIPPALSETILKSIAKDPDARFPSASAMTIAVAEALNVPVPAELRMSAAMPPINEANPSDPLQPSWPQRMTPAPVTPSSLQHSPPPPASPPSAFTPPATDRHTPSTTPGDSRPGSVSSPNPGTNMPASVLPQPSPVSPPAVPLPAAPQRPARQRRTLSSALIALLVAAVVGSGLLLYAFLAPKPQPSNSVVGQVRFLSSPKAPPGSLDEVEVTIRQIHNAPPGKRYYAWLQNSNDSTPPVHWSLATHNGSLSSSHIDPHLLANKPYLFLITAENANAEPLVVATFDPRERLYYANLPADIHILDSFSIQPCPQSASKNICMS
jgi:eukaryotic-like serine/threonine-protein kinase